MTDEEFADWWVLLKSTLAPHTQIRHWSAAKGHLSQFFDASPGPYTSHECIQVDGPQRIHIYQRMVFADDFRAVLNLWGDYCKGQIPRRAIDSVTKHSHTC